jgi:hypothetical protein
MDYELLCRGFPAGEFLRVAARLKQPRAVTPGTDDIVSGAAEV